MKPITDSQLQTLQDRLLNEREELEQHFEINEQSTAGINESLRSSTNELSAYDNHPADLGTEVFERGRDLALNETISKQLDEINLSLEKMKTGQYGKCEVCGKAIPFERLEAIPYTSCCVEHAAQNSGTDISRPVEEDVMTPPPGGAGENRQKHAGRFDDADAWKTVEGYGTSNSPAMEAEREVTGYSGISSDKLDEDGQVEELEKFVANDIRGQNPHIQQTKPLRDYVQRGEGELPQVTDNKSEDGTK
ncbi:MAG: transcriptional regulator, TraR/DksA family [Paenibacillus sp.]|jgi:YteA family regulatory protein|nr:transcriptional regulator, TraR/DksA family [Paenibacillus sp.]